MRTCEKNKIDMWYVNKEADVEEVDEDGNYTGYKVASYSTPTKCRIPLYPSNGTIRREIFGNDENFDMITVTDGHLFSENTLLFRSEPTTTDYLSEYDYRVSRLSEGLNNVNYGLVKRV